MFQFIQRLRSLFGLHGERSTDDNDFAAILYKDLTRLREVNPQTHQQWLSLERAITRGKTETSRIKPRFAPRFAVVVAVVAIAIAGGYVYFASLRPSSETFATRRGEQKEVLLKDGSQVILSCATKVVVPRLTPGMPRRVSLTGEAYFRVRSDEAPFIVSTGYADVHVVGTEFNLRAREGMLEVAVISGIVRVSVPRNGEGTSLLLSQYQRALCLQNDIPERIDDIPSPQYPGWMHGKLFLNRTSLPAACREIEMRFDVSITIDPQDVRNKVVTGVLDARTAESALAALCGLTGKRFTHEGEVYIIH